MDGLRLERVRASAQWRDGTFHNPLVQRAELQGASLPVLGEWLFKRGHRKPPAPLPFDRPHERWGQPVDTGLRATWLGHSTVLLELDGRRVLTDPVLATRIGPVSFVGPKRFHPAPATVEELPPLDVVLVSHDHFDHLCRRTIEQLARRRVPFVTALGVGVYLERYGVDPAVITELDWNERAEVAGIRFTATPSQHFSGRGLTSRNRTLWASWVIESERHKVFFSGDTGLFPGMAEIGEKLGPFDVTMIEVGQYHRAWPDWHIGPEQALIAHRMVRGKVFFPIHWGLFELAAHGWTEPMERALAAAEKSGAVIVSARPGRSVETAGTPAFDRWWPDEPWTPGERDPIVSTKMGGTAVGTP